MEAHNFIAKLKANEPEEDVKNLERAYAKFKQISNKLPSKERIQFALNILCIFSRNLEVPGWCDSVSIKDLLIFCIDCVRQMRESARPDKVNTLACILQIQKHIVRQTASVQPELVLKLSYMVFEGSILNEYGKTYWNILVHRLTYIERLKAEKIVIIKLLPKFIEDLECVIKIYDTVPFCTNVLVFVIKKLYSLYSDLYYKNLNEAFNKIFEVLMSKEDSKPFRSLKEKEILNLYEIFNECFYVIVENSSKYDFKEPILNDCVRTCMSLLGHRGDIFHCLQTYYLNGLCGILTDKCNTKFIDTVFNGLLIACESNEKLGYHEAMLKTYPYLGQCLRIFIENKITKNKDCFKEFFTEDTQITCMKLIRLLMEKYRYVKQMLKCEKCDVKSGLHDALRISFLPRHFITLSIENKIDISKLLPEYYTILEAQMVVVDALGEMLCKNYANCHKKAQSDTHNTAIVLNKAKYYEYSIKLFDIYLKNEMTSKNRNCDLSNISRAYFNKSICEMDSMKLEEALQSSYLSYIFSGRESLVTNKHISLVIDIKSKQSKTKDDINESDSEINKDLRCITVLDAYKEIKKQCDGYLGEYLKELNVIELLEHEFEVYAKLWPSLLPLVGVWRSFVMLIKCETDESECERVKLKFCNVVLGTLECVRSIQNEVFSEVIHELSEGDGDSLMFRLFKAVLLFVKTEYSLAEAAEKYEWKVPGPITDINQYSVNRTIPQEYDALQHALRSVEMLTQMLNTLPVYPDMELATFLKRCLKVYSVNVLLLLRYEHKAHGLELAHMCCEIAHSVGDKITFMHNAGLILSHAAATNDKLRHLATRALRCARDAIDEAEGFEAAILLICDVAIFSSKFYPAEAAHLVQYAQVRLLMAFEANPELKLDMAIGRLMEAQMSLCSDSDSPCVLVEILNVHRHYLLITNNVFSHLPRRYLSQRLGLAISRSSRATASRCADLRLWRRARATALAAAHRSTAPSMAALYTIITCCDKPDDAQVKIDNRLKHSLGLQSTNETQPYVSTKIKNTDSQFLTKSETLETMLDSQMFKKNQTSPSDPCLSVPKCKIPEFFYHKENCTCYACGTPYIFLLASQSSGLQASMYFKSKEVDIAKNYFDGALKIFNLAENKLESSKKHLLKCGFQPYIVELVDSALKSQFQVAEVRFLIELAYFDLSQQDFTKADDDIVRIHEIMQDSNAIDDYLKNEINNLLCASAHLKKTIKKPKEIPQETGIEVDLENLKLSPVPNLVPPPKTPEVKPDKPPKQARTKLVIKEDELPTVKRKVMKLNLDEAVEDEPPKPEKKTRKFKVPEPVTIKPVLEKLTPRPTRSKPNLVVTQPSVDVLSDICTPKAIKALEQEFFTPIDKDTSTEFFTPATSIKCYKKKNNLEQKLIKNLARELAAETVEAESTKENDRNGLKLAKSKIPRVEKATKARNLKRATSPGKLEPERPRTRAVRASKDKNPGADVK